MPKYKVLEKSHLPDGRLGMRIYEEGETVDYDGLPGPNLEPMCEVGRAKQGDYLTALAEQRKVRAEMYPAMEFDMRAFAQELAKAIVAEKGRKV